MQRNVGSRERYWRLGIGAFLLAAAIMAPTWFSARFVMGILGLAGLTTGIWSYCPVNQYLEIDNFSEPFKDEKPKHELPKKAA